MLRTALYFKVLVILAVLCQIYAFRMTSTSSSRASPLLMSSKVKRNPNFEKLKAGYLFPEIGRRRSAYLAANPDAKLISLGIGDTTQPVPKHILSGLVNGASKLGTKETYSGYGAENGVAALREKISSKLYNGLISPDEVFCSDGAKCDIMRLQVMFGSNVVSAVQDPSYPVYVDTSVMFGQTGEINEATTQFDNLVYMECNKDNGFWPDFSKLKQRPDVIYICSPNNPTGATATRAQLEETVAYCKKEGSICVFDAAYAPFIKTPGIPKSIYEIPGAKECAIEVNSFSKYAGFTGVRLGWTIVPEDLKFADGSSVKTDFNRVMSTGFNGASNIVQNGGLACLDDEGLAEIDVLIDYYLENAKILKSTFKDLGFEVYGGDDAPYIFVYMGDGVSSWDKFSEFLENLQVVTTPGAGFGPGGEGYVRLSAFAPREGVLEACERFKKFYAKN